MDEGGQIHEQGEAIRQLEEERRRLQALFDTIPSAIFIADASGRFIQTNELFKTLWGGDVPLPRGFGDYHNFQGWWSETGFPLKPDDWGVSRAIRKGETSIGEMVDIRRVDGSIGTIVIASAPVLDKDGKIIGGICAGQDITVQRRLEKLAKETLERNELYVDVLSHDIGNLNAAALGYLQLLVDKESLGEKERGWALRAIDSVTEVSRLVDMMRKIQATGSLDEARVQDLDDLILQIVSEYESITERNMVINYAGVKGYQVLATGLLRDAFTAIIGNAITHSTGALTIDITVDEVSRAGGTYHRVRFADNGPGIPDEMKATIFSRVKRGATKGVGSGLGLFLVQRLVEGMGGEITVEDRVPGDNTKGSSFSLLFPRPFGNGPLYK
jgi:signal transduction histidine kinase